MSWSKGESAHGDPSRGAVQAPDLAPGTVLGKYRIVRSLGSGGMAAVYEAIHTGIGKPVAIKTLRAVATDANAEARFLREAAAASRLDHPHVVDVTDFGTERGLSFLVMELLRGEDFGAVIAREPGALAPAFVADIMLAVCAGVFAAHESGVIHRDLKPQNIFLARTPLGELVPKVLDFGISKRLDEDAGSALTGTGALVGTTQYMSPEQVSGKSLDVRSDQYALGVILYEALTGRRPHEGNTAYMIMHSIGEGNFVLPRKLRPDVPGALEAVLVRAMSRKPQDRFESVHELGRALLAHASSKRRVIWSDYYERDRPPVSPAAPPSYPDPPRPPVQEGTVAIDAFRARRGNPTETRSFNLPRPPAATRMASALDAPPPRPDGQAMPSSERSESSGGASVERPAPSARSGGLRRAVVIAGLIALGAGGYAAWVDPDIAHRVPGHVKASIKRVLPRAEELRQSLETAGPTPESRSRPMPTETRVTLPSETPVLLDEKPIPMQGGLTPPSLEEIEAQQKIIAASVTPDAAPLAAESPGENAAPARNAAVDRGRLSAPMCGRGSSLLTLAGDATMRAMRLLRKQTKAAGIVTRVAAEIEEIGAATRADPHSQSGRRPDPGMNGSQRQGWQLGGRPGHGVGRRVDSRTRRGDCSSAVDRHVAPRLPQTLRPVPVAEGARARPARPGISRSCRRPALHRQDAVG